MPIAIQTQKITGSNSGTFTFTDTVGPFVYALNYLNWQTQPPNAQIQNIGVSLQVGSDAEADPATVIIDQTLLMDDVDPSSSYTYVTVVAWIGSDDPPGLVMQNQHGIPVDQMSSQAAQKPLPTSYPPVYAVAAISGFSYTFAEDDSDFLSLGVGVGVTYPLTSRTPAVSAVATGIWTGDSAFSGTVDAAVIAMTPEGAGLGLGLAYLPNAAPVTQTIGPLPALGGASVASAAFLLQSFWPQFDPTLDPTPDISQICFGVSPTSVMLNEPDVGEVTAVSEQGLQDNDYNGSGATVTASNALVNYLLVECS
ncbi:hypothetical protein ACIBIZ_12295 [Nonomuraea spiralis]|uniref:hypothetical protein n=1 Tax=Nonomuraea TaxID=83681 RepID=UPI000F7BA132|nr:hypothetical protein [Nonomuraea sp. WAC 01424]RSM98211.1 hypothetical protein DMB42_45235 [Nonomuraea sp. WAC 01424]